MPYRIFNDAEYRFYRQLDGMPSETDEPFAVASALPASPTETFSDGTWRLSASYFNGVIDSGFLPIGPNGETHVVLVVSDSGASGTTPPADPRGFRLVAEADGVIRVTARYAQADADRADQWAIFWGTSSPPATEINVVIGSSGTQILSYALPAQSDGMVVYVRLMTRRNDGGNWVYSSGATTKTATANADGPSASPAAGRWSE